MPEAIAFVAGLHDVAVVRQPIQQRRGHLRVAEHTRPFGEVEIRCNGNTRAPDYGQLSPSGIKEPGISGI